MRIHNCEQGSPEWSALRAGLPTASEFSKLITSTGEPSKSLPSYAITLAAEKYAGKPVDAWEGNSYTERGKLLEDDARSWYAFVHDAELTSVGFVTNDAQSFGCSPDSFVGNEGLLEIKCLKAENHVKALLYYGKHKKTPPDYVQQTQGQIMVCQRQWSDLVFFHPDLPSLVIRQEKNADLQVSLMAQIECVISERDRVYAELMQYRGAA